MLYTPGPWKVFNQTDVFTDYEKALDGYHIADCMVHSSVASDYPEMSVREQVANAHLIAAAPDLLEAARQALHYMRLHEYADQVWADDLEKAITKAQGETP